MHVSTVVAWFFFNIFLELFSKRLKSLDNNYGLWAQGNLSSLYFSFC